ncbi:MAG: hypothetical protein ACREK2_04430, partial [Gemmatimonadota bacterium]
PETSAQKAAQANAMKEDRDMGPASVESSKLGFGRKVRLAEADWQDGSERPEIQRSRTSSAPIP